MTPELYRDLIDRAEKASPKCGHLPLLRSLSPTEALAHPDAAYWARGVVRNLFPARSADYERATATAARWAYYQRACIAEAIKIIEGEAKRELMERKLEAEAKYEPSDPPHHKKEEETDE